MPISLKVAVGSIIGQVKTGGLFVASIRDYDSLLDSKPPYSPPYIHKTERGQRVSFQTWVWNGDNYQLTQYIIDDEENLQIGKFVCEYRATRREELTNLLLSSGRRINESAFIQWLQSGDLEIPGGIRILSTDCNCQKVKFQF